MTKIARVAWFVASVMATAFMFSATASAVEPQEVIERYQGTYTIVDVVVSETDPTVYEMTIVLEDGTAGIILVDVETGDIIVPEDEGPADVGATDPVTKDECKEGGWEAFGFRNQGQCIRYMNTAFDDRTEDPGDEEAENEADDLEEGEGAGDECRNGGWEALGYRNQGACMRELGE